jgi:hypothetical protein
LHGWSGCFGAVFSLAVVSSLYSAGYTPADFTFKNAVDVVVLAGLVWVGVRQIRLKKLAHASQPQARLTRTANGA